MDRLLQDIRFGLRMLARSKGVTMVAVLTLALGIGANTSIFSVANAVLLRPMPYPEPDRLVAVQEAFPKLVSEGIPFSAPDVVEFRKQNQVFEHLAAFNARTFDISGIDRPERVDAARVSAALFPLLGTRPRLGRTFTEDEDRGGDKVVVLSHGLWQRLFGADRGLIGNAITMNRIPYAVIGVMPPEFEFPHQGMPYSRRAELWVPMSFTERELSSVADNFNHGVIARMKPGITIERAREDVNAIAQRIQETYPAEVADYLPLEARVTPMQEYIVGNVRPLLLVLMVAVGMVLLIGCANVANLLLMRATGRQREMAVRAAMGAGRSRLLRQLFTESLLMALMGGGLGVALSYWGTGILVGSMPTSIPRAGEISLDITVLAFAMLLSLVTGMIFGLTPAVGILKYDLNSTLKQGGRSELAGRCSGWVTNALVASEVALALLLLIAAGLLTRSFVALLNTDPGFKSEQTLTLGLSLPLSTYSRKSDIEAFYRRLMDRLIALPGVQHVGGASSLPTRQDWQKIYSAAGRRSSAPAEQPIVFHSIIYGDYFKALSIPLKEGRDFNEGDRREGAQVLIVNEELARRFWPGESAVGKRLKNGPPESDAPWISVVGVVGDVKQSGVDTEVQPHTYQPFSQAGIEYLRVVMKSQVEPSSLFSAVMAQVRELDPQLPVSDLLTLEQVLSDSRTERRFNMVILTAFASAALFLAAIGIFGVMAYSVSRRTQEFGVRMALGAARSDVFRLVLRRGMAPVMIGLAIGIAAAYGLSRFLAGFLYGVQATDALTFAAVALVLFLVAMVAGFMPARRATRVDPVVALRYE